jgi:ubiquinone/menaquinone biosynthesis C-methylase UbiE
MLLLAADGHAQMRLLEANVKVFDSGMPEEAYWNSLFNIQQIVKWLNITDVIDPIAEIGCGYGTFTVPVARKFDGIVHAFDIEPMMVETARNNARRAGIQNVTFHLRDILLQGTGLASQSIGMVLLFNILHSIDKHMMLCEASRILKRSGIVAIIHWRKDIETPRGPSLESRPDKATILDSVDDLDLLFKGNSRILEPYHWGIQLIRGDKRKESP